MAGAVLTAERTGTDGRAGVLKALRRLNGRATVADIVAATGLVQATAETALRELLGTHTGHVEVGEKGDLVYAFDPRLLTREHRPWWRRALDGLKRVAKVAFKAWIAVTLVFYFLLFLVLAIAAVVVVIARGGGDDVDIDLRGGGRGLSLDWLWILFWAPDFRWGSPYYGQRYERLHGRKRRVPFYKKVFAFVFGPDEPKRTPEQRDRDLVRLIRARAGALTAAELVLYTGAPADEAKSELGRLMGAYDGDARATEDGEVVYLFPELMVSAHGRVRETAPPPAWKRLIPQRPLTGNTTGSNVLIGAINGFNLAGVVAAVAFIMPTLGFQGPLAWTTLVWIPLVFTLLFFTIPLVRLVRVRRENGRRTLENIRRVALGPVFEASIDGRAIDEMTVLERVRAVLPKPAPSDADVRRALQRLVAEFDGEIEIDEAGRTLYRFPHLRREVGAGATVRRATGYDTRTVGAVVYSSDDDEQEAGRRELETFDRDLRRTLSQPGAAYLDELEDGERASPDRAPPRRR